MNVHLPNKRPIASSATGRVWVIADEMLAEFGHMPKGRQVVDAYLAEDSSRNQGTGFTQYSHWKKNHESRYKRAGKSPAASDSPPVPTRLTVADNGRVVIPADIRRAMELDEAGTVLARFEDGQLCLISPTVAQRRAQELVKSFDLGGGSVVDELINERRAEATRE